MATEEASKSDGCLWATEGASKRVGPNAMYTNLQKYCAEPHWHSFPSCNSRWLCIMAENLAGGNVAIALLGNTIPTGAILVVLITMLGPISGAHFNPAVTMVFALKKEISISDSAILHHRSNHRRYLRRMGRSHNVRH